MWGRRPRLDGESQDRPPDDSDESEHERVKSVADGGFLVRLDKLKGFVWVERKGGETGYVHKESREKGTCGREREREREVNDN